MDRLTGNTWFSEFITGVIGWLLFLLLLSLDPWKGPIGMPLPMPTPMAAALLIAAGMSIVQTYIGPATTLFLFLLCTLPGAIFATVGMAYWLLYMRPIRKADSVSLYCYRSVT